MLKLILFILMSPFLLSTVAFCFSKKSSRIVPVINEPVLPEAPYLTPHRHVSLSDHRENETDLKFNDHYYFSENEFSHYHELKSDQPVYFYSSGIQKKDLKDVRFLVMIHKDLSHYKFKNVSIILEEPLEKRHLESPITFFQYENYLEISLGDELSLEFTSKVKIILKQSKFTKIHLIIPVHSQ